MANIEANQKSLVPEQPERSDKVVNLMLQAMDLYVEDLKGKINVSHKLLPHGIDTELTSELKRALSDPIQHVLDNKDTMDGHISTLLTLVAKNFFQLHNDKIAAAFKTDIGSNKELHFSIVLSDDTFENRNEILGFLAEYKSTKNWDSFPIKFQFMPATVAERIANKQQVL